MPDNQPHASGDPGPGHAEPTGSPHVGALVARLVERPDGAGRRDQGRALGSLTTALAASARTAGRASVLGGRWLTDLLVDVAPRIPVRDLQTLQAQHPGLGQEDLAEALIAGAAKGTAAVGAAGGALAAVEFTAPPTLLTAPAQIAAETLVVAAIEIKLMAELHEVYGRSVGGGGRARASAYLMAWTTRRGVDPFDPATLRFALGSTAKRAIRVRLVKRAGRNLSTLGPMMSGAVAGSIVNHRESRRLGNQVRDDLRPRSPAFDAGA